MKKLIILLILLSATTYGAWYDNAINTVTQKGIMQGDSKGFRPNDYVKRSELAQALVNMMNTESGIINVVANATPSTVQIISGNNLGSGVYVAENKILTASHVITDENNITIKTTTKTFSAKFIKRNTRLDLAILEVEEIGKPVKLAESVKVGESAIAIGSPRGLSFSVSKGIISHTNRNINFVRHIQFDTSVNSGNSGGALFDSEGDLLGIVVLKHKESEGIAYAVPYSLIKIFIKGVI